MHKTIPSVDWPSSPQNLNTSYINEKECEVNDGDSIDVGNTVVLTPAEGWTEGEYLDSSSNIFNSSIGNDSLENVYENNFSNMDSGSILSDIAEFLISETPLTPSLPDVPENKNEDLYFIPNKVSTFRRRSRSRAPDMI